MGSQSADSGKIPAFVLPVGYDYFRTLQIPILEGRSFTESDDAAAARVAIVSRASGLSLWGGDDPVGKTFNYAGSEYRVVGVAGDVRQAGLLAEQGLLVYVPFRQNSDCQATLVLHTSTRPEILAAAVRDEVASMDPDVLVDSVQTLTSRLSESLAQPRFYATLVGTFGGLTVLLAVAGLYVVVLLMVRGRLFELGVRAALGAGPRDNLFLVLGQGLSTSVVGVIAGLAGGLYLGRFLAGLLYELEPADPLTVAIVAILMLFASVLAVVTPALQAARVDPVQVLRGD